MWRLVTQMVVPARARQIRILCVLLLGVLSLHQALAEEQVSVDVALKPPTAFFKPVPESISDLKTIQDYLHVISPQLVACTVGVRIGHSQGSGVIVTKEGFILTAAHVSGQPGRVAEIILPDGTVCLGKTAGRNRVLDASMVKIDGNRANWPFASLAPRNDLKVGDWCIATGHPGGHQRGRKPVLRLGRVFGKDLRSVQSDCELVGGDSGGPLFDVNGHVIGIHSHIENPLNRNFHVRGDIFHDDWERLVAAEDFSARSGAMVGLSGRDHAQGLEITKIFPGEPADEAGLKEGDILVLFEKTPVKSLNQLIDLIQAEFPGRAIRMQVLRDGKPVDVKVHLGIRVEQ